MCIRDRCVGVALGVGVRSKAGPASRSAPGRPMATLDAPGALPLGEPPLGMSPLGAPARDACAVARREAEAVARTARIGSWAVAAGGACPGEVATGALIAPAAPADARAGGVATFPAGVGVGRVIVGVPATDRGRAGLGVTCAKGMGSR